MKCRSSPQTQLRSMNNAHFSAVRTVTFCTIAKESSRHDEQHDMPKLYPASNEAIDGPYCYSAENKKNSLNLTYSPASWLQRNNHAHIHIHIHTHLQIHKARGCSAPVQRQRDAVGNNGEQCCVLKGFPMCNDDCMTSDEARLGNAEERFFAQGGGDKLQQAQAWMQEV
eukprot:1160568-Pelagomonas_calceolata.AAC.3